MSTLLLYAVTGLMVVLVGGAWFADWVMGKEDDDGEEQGGAALASQAKGAGGGVPAARWGASQSVASADKS